MKRTNNKLTQGIFLFTIISLLIACAPKEKEVVAVEEKEDLPLMQGPLSLPSWAINANIYEVNIRQYTPEGTINAFAAQIPRLKEMGVDILWIMPVQPISKKNRKGGLGSPYSIANYTAVNPDYGTMDDFKKMVETAHSNGMRVILDWVANHTGFDHAWTTEHPDWYKMNGDTIRHAHDNEDKPTDWYDVADLNYDNAEMRTAMMNEMAFWVSDADLDGFRCDVAGFVPTDFWAALRPKLDSIKPVFMLAEWEDIPEHFDVCFNMNYGWSFHHMLNDLANGKKNANQLDSFLQAKNAKFPEHYFQMHFVTNHDENSWKGTTKERMGEAADAMTVLAFTLEGMPLIYSGQESGETKKLSFFEKDSIDWGNYEKAEFLKTLLLLKKNNKALWNGPFGGKARRLNTGEGVYAFERQKDGDAVVVLINVTNKPQTTSINSHYHALKNAFTGATIDIHEGDSFDLPPYGYFVLSGQEYSGGAH
jgi:alpha-amylase